MKYILSITCLLTFTVPVIAQSEHPCDPYAPYYHKIETGPGALIADLFFFVMSAPVVIATAGGSHRPVVNTQTGERREIATAACLPISTARHFFQNRPPHAEHWIAYE